MDYQQPPQDPNSPYNPGGYPPQQGGYPQGGYPPPVDYSQQGGYSQQPGGYPPGQDYGQYNQQPGYPPPQQPYGGYPPQQPYGYQPEVPGKGKATASMVLGIISCLFMWMGYAAFLSTVMAIIGLILGVSARKSIPAGMPGAGQATAGLVLNIIALIISLITIVACVICVGTLASTSYYW